MAWRYGLYGEYTLACYIGLAGCAIHEGFGWELFPVMLRR